MLYIGVNKTYRMDNKKLEPALENNIQKLKDNLGHLSLDDFKDFPQVSKNIIAENLLGYGLIIRQSSNSNGFMLTKDGWHFTTFKNERDNLVRQDNLIASNIAASHSVKETNISIQNLNDKTEGYYKIQKCLTYVIAIATVVNVLVAIGTFIKDYKKNESDQQYKLLLMQTKVQQLQNSMKIQEVKDSFFEHQVKDSLKIPQ